MDVFAVVLLAAISVASLPVGGPIVILPILAVLNIPSGFQDAAIDFLKGGGWIVFAAGAAVALGGAIHYLRQPRPERSGKAAGS